MHDFLVSAFIAVCASLIGTAAGIAVNLLAYWLFPIPMT